MTYISSCEPMSRYQTNTPEPMPRHGVPPTFSRGVKVTVRQLITSRIKMVYRRHISSRTKAPKAASSLLLQRAHDQDASKLHFYPSCNSLHTIAGIRTDFRWIRNRLQLLPGSRTSCRRGTDVQLTLNRRPGQFCGSPMLIISQSIARDDGG